MTAQMLKHAPYVSHDGNHRDAKAELFSLQLEQHHHDENYHREIARLSIHQRLNHMTLHLAKYLGGIAEAHEANANDPTATRLIVDTLIIGTSTANILNLKISDLLISEGAVYPNLTALGKFYLKKEADGTFSLSKLLIRMAAAVGHMAKACESVDHLETLPRPYREIMQSNLAIILKSGLMSMAAFNLDPGREIRTRLDAVKSRSIFHGQPR